METIQQTTNWNRALLKKQIISMFIILAISASFFLLYCFIVNTITDEPVSKFLPGASDASDYYTEIGAAIRAGIFSRNAGYNGYIFNTDVLCVADSLFYGAHGLFILLPYIFFGKIIGWGGASPLIIHMVLFTIAFFFIYFCTASIKKTIAVQILCFTFVPLIRHFSTMMMEMQMYAWGILLAALLYAYIKSPNKFNQTGLLIAIVLASSVRITNIIFGIPYFILTIRDLFIDGLHSKKVRRDLFVGFITIVFIIFLFYLNKQLSAEYLSGFKPTLKLKYQEEGIKEAFIYFLSHFNSSLNAYFNPGASPIFVLLRYSVLGLALILLMNAFISFHGKKIKIQLNNIMSLSLSIVLFSIALLNIMFYDIFGWRDFRVMATIFLAVVVYSVINYDKNKLLACLSVLLSLSFLFFLNTLPGFINGRFGDNDHNGYISYIHYNPDAKTRFENTIIIKSFDIMYHDIDPGLCIIGVIGEFMPEYAAELGVKYILVGKKSVFDENDYYRSIANGDNWILYILCVQPDY